MHRLLQSELLGRQKLEMISYWRIAAGSEPLFDILDLLESCVQGKAASCAVRLFKVYFCALSDSLVGQQTSLRGTRLRVTKPYPTTFQCAYSAWAAGRGSSCKATRYPLRTKEQGLGLLDEATGRSHRTLASSLPGADYARFPCGCLKL